MANKFSVGRDVSLIIVDPIQGAQRFKIKTGWKSDPQYIDLKSKGLDGVPNHDNVPDGHNITLDLDRQDASVERYFANREATYFNGQENPLVMIDETISERDGSVTQFRYTGISLKLTNAGTWSGNEVTKQSISGYASRKILLN